MKKNKTLIIGLGTLVLIIGIGLALYFVNAPKISIGEMPSKALYSFITESEIASIINEEESKYSSVDFEIIDTKVAPDGASFDGYNYLIRQSNRDIDFGTNEGIPITNKLKVRISAKKLLFKKSVIVDIPVTDDIKPEIKVFFQDEQIPSGGSVTLGEGSVLKDALHITATDTYFDTTMKLDYKSDVNLNTEIIMGDVYWIILSTKDGFGNEAETSFVVNVDSSPIVSTKPPVDPEEVSPNSDILLVNRTVSLPDGFTPHLLIFPEAYSQGQQFYATEATVNAFSTLVETMAQETGMRLNVATSYRSYDDQAEIYNSYVARFGQEEADKLASKPGTSEHQTGLAMDVQAPGVELRNFETTAQYPWLVANAHRFGFVMRYPLDKEAITQYAFEPWHIRYVGEEIAEKMYTSGQSLEEYIESN